MVKVTLSDKAEQEISKILLSNHSILRRIVVKQHWAKCKGQA